MSLMEVEDDGRTISSMDFEALTGKTFGFKKKSKTENSRFNGILLTKKERFAMIKAALLAVLPITAAFGGLFLLAFLLMDIFWLN